MTQTNKEQHEKQEDFFSHMKKIYEITQQAGGLTDLFYEYAAPHLAFIKHILKLSETEAALFAALAHLYKGNVIEISQLAEYLHICCIEAVNYIKYLEILAEKELIIIHKNNTYGFDTVSTEKIYFELKLETVAALIKGEYSKLSGAKNLTIEKFFRQVENLCEERVQKRRSMESTINKMNKLLQNNGHLVFVQKIKKLGLSAHDTLVLLRFFHYTVNMDEPEMTFRHLMGLYDHASEFTHDRRWLKNGEHALQTKGLIENAYDDGYGSAEAFCLTDKAKEYFLTELDYSLSKSVIKGLKNYNDIKEKKLFYPEKTQTAIDELTSLLQPKSFFQIQKRLSENNMRTGFACLFSGSPGTGKTETVYQIAKLCRRDIMQVDISSVKCKWFGESEKQLKSLFDKYRACVKKAK